MAVIALTMEEAQKLVKCWMGLTEGKYKVGFSRYNVEVGEAGEIGSTIFTTRAKRSVKNERIFDDYPRLKEFRDNPLKNALEKEELERVKQEILDNADKYVEYTVVNDQNGGEWVNQE